AGNRDLLCHIGLLDPGRSQRKHLHVNAGGVHLSQTPVADILKLLKNLRTAGPRIAVSLNKTLTRPRNKSAARRLFFQGDGPQFRAHSRRVAHGVVIALRNCRRRHRYRSSADRRSVEKVAPIHDSPPDLKALCERRRCELTSIVGTTLSPWTTLGN